MFRVRIRYTFRLATGRNRERRDLRGVDLEGGLGSDESCENAANEDGGDGEVHCDGGGVALEDGELGCVLRREKFSPVHSGLYVA